MNKEILWGIDLGGTKIECVVIDKTDHTTMLRERISTNAEKGYLFILGRIKELIDICAKKINQYPNQIGIGTPGSLDPITGLMKNSNSTAINGKALKKDLEILLSIPITLANDANCFALAEYHLGVIPNLKRKVQTVLGLILGTGVGSGIIVNGHVLIGAHGIAGEWGHNYLDMSGGKCYCGRFGCVETVISGPALESFYQKKAGVSKKLQEIVNDKRTCSDNISEETIRRLIEMFGKAIAPVINILDPDVIVLGGGVGNIDELILDSTTEIEKHLFNSELKTLLIKPALGDSAGVYGAAMLCL